MAGHSTAACSHRALQLHVCDEMFACVQAHTSSIQTEVAGTSSRGSGSSSNHGPLILALSLLIHSPLEWDSSMQAMVHYLLDKPSEHPSAATATSENTSRFTAGPSASPDVSGSPASLPAASAPEPSTDNGEGLSDSKPAQEPRLEAAKPLLGMLGTVAVLQRNLKGSAASTDERPEWAHHMQDRCAGACLLAAAANPSAAVYCPSNSKAALWHSNCQLWLVN